MSQAVIQACEQVQKQEAWKYTDLSAICAQTFQLGDAAVVIAAEVVAKYFLPDQDVHRLVFINGHYVVQHSLLSELPTGVCLMSVKNALQQYPEHVQPLLENKEQSFIQLNAMLMSDGWFLYLPANVRLQKPIHVLYLTMTEQSTMAHMRNIGIFSPHSEAVIIEEYVGLNQEKYFNNVVTQLQVDVGAQVQHYRLQNESQQGFHISNTQVTQQQDSRVAMCNLAVGGQLSRDESNIFLQHPGAECELSGLYLLNEKQHNAQYIRIQHQAAHTTSKQFYKGILDQYATAAFDGKVIVHPQAQKINAQQTNQNLLLAKTAEVNTKPALEIYADDVKCTHGATVGQLDQQALFYLRSRGIEKQAAIELLTSAFGNEVIETIKIPVFLKKCQQIVQEKLRCD